MDWKFLKKIFRIFLGVLLLVGGLWLMIRSFSGGFEITLAFLGFLVLSGGLCCVLFGLNALSSGK
ncbi:MAG: hypothetical protein IKM59_00965 [Oscillospiraceae bacterium]|nr:hypothetical protein [Oscillospiraceae bacterium]